MDIKRERGTGRTAIRLLAAALILTSALILAACGRSATPYTVISPSVNPGGTLTGEDFIMVSAFSEVEYTAELDGELDTSMPGLHTVSVKVTGGGEEKTYSCTYTVRSYLHDSVRVEAGSGVITAEQFVNRDVLNASSGLTVRFEDEAAVQACGLGSHKIGIYVGDALLHSTLILQDTTPPTASPVTVFITNETGEPKPEDFLAGITDATSVACEFKEEYDFNTTDDIYVTIIMTDEAGNRSEVVSYATCSVDVDPPVIEGVHDFEVIVGGTVSYKEGVTVSDNSGEKLKITVDNSRVDLNKIGSYEVSYSAVDSAGNSTIVRATVNVVEKPAVTEEELTAEARRIYDEKINITAGMTTWDIAKAIYQWTHDSIKYTTEQVDKDNYLQGAYDGFTLGKGDCFTYMAVAKALYDVAGIKNLQIDRQKYSGEAAHYWLLIDIGDGWYHVDSCPHFSGMFLDSFMLTDAELKAYCDEYDIEYYYRFDKTKYPARATVSYYESVTPETTPDTTPDTTPETESGGDEGIV